MRPDLVIGVVDRGEAIENRWLHRVATTVCRDARGRILVHRRQKDLSRFPGQYNWLIGGAAEVGESYEEAAARELTEELGVAEEITADPAEIAWHAWLTESELRLALRRWAFVPDGVEALQRYL
ncbi:NUDIX domain-containing protein [Streptomyces sp. UG1]|uniref:NUDIX domain-containing protein n=1 Tax=Streptomyces sp. UG1 TaxID=3417652 RepID=UPI003CEBD001